MSTKGTTITLLHAYGQSIFDSEAVKAYGSLEALTASEILQGVPNREKSLTQLWEAAHIEVPEDEQTETEGA